jgi:diaminopimelate epimerase
MFTMDYYNSDGIIGSMCGNGGRTAIAYASSIQVLNSAECVFDASNEIYFGKIISQSNGLFQILLKLQNVSKVKEFSDKMYFLNTGSPHLVIYVEDVDAVDVFREGREWRYSKQLPEGGANINFVQIVDDGIKVRTYERGVENETLSCGTGSTAAAIATAIKLEKQNNVSIQVKTTGGDLVVWFDRNSDFQNVCLQGPVEFVFEGQYKI